MLRLKCILIIIILLFVKQTYSQKNKDVIELNSYESNYKNNNDLKKIDYFFDSTKVIGLGESTHGTSEFSKIRLRLFKYLVLNHKFNTFFLEADYAACKNINRFIKGKFVNVDSVMLNNIKLWPWLTYEMRDIILWMKKYNEKNNNVLNFVGCDMQFIDDDYKELNLLFAKDKIMLNKVKVVFDAFKQKMGTKKTVTNAIKNWNLISNKVKDTLIVLGVNQWISRKLSFTYYFRDSCMANNILTYLKMNSNAKGVYFAHNFHVVNLFSQNKSFKSKAGGYLKYRLKNKYKSIACLTNEGRFLATTYSNKKYSKQIFALTPSKKKSIEYHLSKLNKSILFTQYQFKNNCEMTNIGAVYGTSKSGRKIPRYIKYQKYLFDAFLYIKKTTPSTFL